MISGFAFHRRWLNGGLLAAAGLAVALTQGCVATGTSASVTSGQGSDSMGEKQSVAYDGPQARIAVSRFDDKTGKGWYSGEIGDGMADMMTTALVNTDRYIVLERDQLGDVMSEQDLGASGRVGSETAAPVGEIEGAELLVTGAVTGFDPGSSGAKARGSGLVGGVLSAVSGGLRKSYMAIDVRVIDTRTSRILAATTVEGEARDVNLGALASGFGSAGSMAAGLSGWENTPTEKALRICIKKAVDFVVSKTPDDYYHYNAGGQSISGPSGGGGETVRVKPSSLNVRSGPGTDHSIAYSARGGEILQVVERQGDWIRVRNDAGKPGWVAGWLVE